MPFWAWLIIGIIIGVGIAVFGCLVWLVRNLKPFG